MTKDDLRIVFLGTPEFAAYSLNKICDAGYNVVGVVTMPDKVGGRGHKVIHSAVKTTAIERGLHVMQPEKLKSPEFVDELRELKADLFIVIAFRMLPEIVWTMPPLGTFNLHASLLPRYRGAAAANRGHAPAQDDHRRNPAVSGGISEDQQLRQSDHRQCAPEYFQLFLVAGRRGLHPQKPHAPHP